MNPSTGYYSLIQYCPDPSRLEAANVGVLLFSPEHLFLKARMASGNQRIRQFFGSEGHDWHRINSFKKGLEERLEVEGGTIYKLEDLQAFITKRANRLQITPSRPMRVTEPEKDLDRLFQELVGGRARGEQPTSLTKYLGEQFARAGVTRKLRTNLQVPIPAFNERWEVPYAFHNGRCNLIRPGRFRAAEAAQVIPSACRYAVAGRSLYEHPDAELGPLQLIVLGDFLARGAESKQVVRRILGENQVRLYTANELDQLIEEIRQTGKDLDGHPSSRGSADSGTGQQSEIGALDRPNVV